LKLSQGSSEEIPRISEELRKTAKRQEDTKSLPQKEGTKENQLEDWGSKKKFQKDFQGKVCA